jgi:cytochrome c oxidase subunit IV
MATTETPREEFEAGGAAHLPEEDLAHPGPRQYVMVAVVLAVLTAMEVALFYIESLNTAVAVAALLILMVIKFALVVLWFMHLRFDSPIYKRLFVAGLGLAAAVFLIVLVTFGVFFRS